jgi:DNA-binding transcriptional MerR regulator
MPPIENQILSKLYYSIGEVASMLEVNASLLRFWEKEFNLTVSKKNNKGNRLFSVKEIEQIQRIYQLVKVQGYTLDGAKKALKQKVMPTILAPTPVVQKAGVANQNFAEIIDKLEGIKARLLSLPIEKEPTRAPVEPPKKRSTEKPKPASDLPTLFDF